MPEVLPWEVFVKQATRTVASAYLQGRSPSVEVLEQTVVATAAAGQWAWALHFLEFPEGRTSRSCEAFLRSLSRSKQWQLHLRLFEELYMKGIPMSDGAVHAALYSCKAASAWAHAEILLTRHPSLKSFSLVLGISPWDRALEILAQMTPAQQSTVSLNHLISSLGQSLRWALALQLGHQRQQLSNGHRMATAKAMISACEKGCQWEAALQLSHELEEAGLVDVVSCSSCIRALAKANQWQRAELLLEKMLRRGPEPNIITFNCLISACGGDQWPRGLHQLSELPLHALVADDFTLVTSISRLPLWQPGLFLLRTSRSQSTECKEAFSALMSSLNRQWMTSLALLRYMHQRDLETSLPCQQGVLLTLKSSDQWERMVNVMAPASHGRSAWRRRGTMSSLQLSTEGRASRWREAVSFFRGMLNGHIEVSSSETTAAISACDVGPQWPLALEIFRRSGMRSTSTFNGAVSACQEGACWVLPLSLLDLMKTCLVKSDALSFNSVLTCCEKAKRWEFSFRLARGASAAAERLDALTASVAAAASAQRWRWALQRMAAGGDAVTAVCLEVALEACEMQNQGRQVVELLDKLQLSG
ncbi:unnamed protein product, partial [Durusdinium trenchii]